MNRTAFDIATEIMVAALQSSVLKADGLTAAARAESIGAAYAIILAAVRQASGPTR